MYSLSRQTRCNAERSDSTIQDNNDVSVSADNMTPSRRRTGGPGGLAQTTPTRRRTPRTGPSALERAYATLGEEVVKQLQSTYASLDSTWGGTEHDQAEGMVIDLLRQRAPDAQIRAVFGVGGSMIARPKLVSVNGVDTLHTRRASSTRTHAFTDDDIAFFLASSSEWGLEDGFPCSHRRPRQYLVEAKVTLDSVATSDARLQRQPLTGLTLKKLKSLSLKYFSIPSDHLAYYPTVPDSDSTHEAQTDANDDSRPSGSSEKRKVAAGVDPPAKKAGRPRKITCDSGTHPSILSFFKPLDRQEPK